MILPIIPPAFCCPVVSPKKRHRALDDCDLGWRENRLMPLLGEIDNRFNGWPEVTAIDIRQSSYYNILTASGYTLVHPHKQDGMLMTGKVALRSFTG